MIPRPPLSLTPPIPQSEGVGSFQTSPPQGPVTQVHVHALCNNRRVVGDCNKLKEHIAGGQGALAMLSAVFPFLNFVLFFGNRRFWEAGRPLGAWKPKGGGRSSPNLL